MNILFVCEDNCGLSLMAESILRSVAPRRFGAYSAGYCPKATVNRGLIEFLAEHHMPVAGLFPKRLDQFLARSPAQVDFVITLCELQAAERLTDLPDDVFIAHWNVKRDEDGDPDQTMRDNFWSLMRRIKIFASLPQAKLDRRRLERRVLTLQPSYL